MDLYPLYNSIRIALLSTAIVFFLGIFAAYYIAKTPRILKGILDVVLTLPLVLPPTVVGFLLRIFSAALRDPPDDDLVCGDPFDGGCDLSPDVPDRAGRL